MSKGTIVFLMLFYVSNGIVFSQHLSHQVMVPAAGIAVSGAVNYTQTIGETAIEIIGCSEFVFTQGFQQPGIKYLKESAPKGNGVDVYPNPVRDYVNVKLFGDGARKFSIDIINIAGTIVNSGTIDFTASYFYIQQIEITNLKKGFYFVRIVSNDRLISRVFKIEKM